MTTYKVRLTAESGRTIHEDSMTRAGLAGFLHGIAYGLEQNPAHSVLCLTVMPVSEPESAEESFRRELHDGSRTTIPGRQTPGTTTPCWSWT